MRKHQFVIKMLLANKFKPLDHVNWNYFQLDNKEVYKLAG